MAGEWQATTLGAIADFLSGGTPTKSNPSYWTGSVPWLSAKDMKEFRVSDTQDHLSDEGAANGTRLVPAGTAFLLTRGMTLLNDVPISVAQREMTFNQDVKALRARPGVRSDYLAYVLLSLKPQLLEMVDLAGHGTGRLNTDELKAICLEIPTDSDEQRAIAHILGTLDDKLELNRRMNETLEAVARAIFKSWFVDFAPVRAKVSGEPPESICHRLRLAPDILALFPDRLVDSELGEIPEGWEVKPLDAIANYLNGLALQKYPPESETEWLPVIKIAQLKSGSTVGADRASHRLDPDYVVDDGDVLFSWSGSLEVGVWCGGRGALNQHLFKVTSKSFPKWFFFHWTREHMAHFRTIAAGKAVTMGHIQRKHLTEALCAVPSGALLEAADEIVAPKFQALIENRRQARTLAATRDTLLPKLLSGERRVPLEGNT